MCVLLGATTGCEWFTDFKRQPHVVTWESWRPDSLGVRGAPQGSVPIDGTAMASWMVSYSSSIATIDSLAGIANPVEVTEASLAAGRMQWQVNCAVCHGDNADGMGNATRYGFPAISLQNETARGRTDGYVFGMIRNGRGLMPPYNRIEERDRWDLINYLRALQGRNTGVPFERGPLERPGVTGDKVPGPSTLGPNRASPYRPTTPAGAPRPGGDR
jgi:mono/diheme cytochrome c family protein